MKNKLPIIILLFLGGGAILPAKVEFGGNLGLDMYYLHQDSNRVAYQVLGDKPEKTKFNDNAETALHSPQMFNRLWLNYTTDNEALSLYMQVRAGSVLKRYEDNTTNRPDHIFSIFYAWLKWQVSDKLSFKAGRQEQAFSILNPNQVLGATDYHGLGANFGDIYGGEGLDGLRMDFSITQSIDISLMLLDTDTDRSNDNNEIIIIMVEESGTDLRPREQNVIPRFDLAFPIKTDLFEIHPSATWLRQSFSHDQSNIDDHFDIWGMSLGAKAKLSGFLLSGEVNFGQNLGDGNYIGAGELFHQDIPFGAAGYYSYKEANPLGTGDSLIHSKVLNTKSLAFWLDIGYEIGSVQPHLLFGTLKIDGDRPPASDTAQIRFVKGRKFPKRVSQSMFGISIPVELTDHFAIIPELMYYDWGGGKISKALYKKHNYFESGVVLKSDGAPAPKQNRGEELIAGFQMRFIF